MQTWIGWCVSMAIALLTIVLACSVCAELISSVMLPVIGYMVNRPHISLSTVTLLLLVVRSGSVFRDNQAAKIRY